jgi:hypothetical protein
LQQLGGNMGGGGTHPKESALSFASLQQHRNRTMIRRCIRARTARVFNHPAHSI